MQFLEQQQEVASQLRLDLNKADQATLVKRWLNQSQQEIWGETEWYFSLERLIVQTVADKTAGTVDVSAGSTTVTGTTTAFAAVDVGKFIQFSSSNDWYKIATVASATSLTIEAAYTQTTSLSAGTYTIRQFFYSLGASAERILDARQAISPSYIDAVHYRDFDIFRANPTSTGSPLLMVLYGIDSSGYLRFTPYPWPDAIINLEIRYKKVATDLSAATDTSLIPAKWHSTVMIDGALVRGHMWALGGQGAVDVAKYNAAIRRYKDGLAKMIEQQDADPSYSPVMQNRDNASMATGPMLPAKYGWDR